MHSDELDESNEAHDGDIVVMFGIDCHSMDTFSNGNRYFWNLVLDILT